MTIRLTRLKLGGVAMGMLLFAAASHAAPPVDGASVKPLEPIVHTHTAQAKADHGRLFRPPQNIKPPAGPRVRDHRGTEPEFVAPRCGHHPRPCTGAVRDHRSK